MFIFFPGRGDSNNKPCTSRFKHLYDHGLLATVSSLAQEGGELTRSAYSLHRGKPTEASTASQRSLHNAPIFRLLLKVAVNGTHQCDFLNFCGGFGSQLMIEIHDASASSVLSRVGGRAGSTQPSPQAYACWKKLASLLPLEKFCYG